MSLFLAVAAAAAGCHSTPQQALVQEDRGRADAAHRDTTVSEDVAGAADVGSDAGGSDADHGEEPDIGGADGSVPDAGAMPDSGSDDPGRDADSGAGLPDAGGGSDAETDAYSPEDAALDAGEGGDNPGDAGGSVGSDAGATDAGADAGCAVHSCVDFGVCASYDTCDPCPEKPAESCNGSDDDCDPATLEEGLALDCPAGELCRGGFCCSDECSPPGARECVDLTHARLCGQRDADSCTEWAAPEECPQNHACSGAGVCACAGPACFGACCAATQTCGRFACCTVETDARFCSRMGKMCGPASGNDLCGWWRSADCGVCGQFPGSFCGSGVCQCRLKNCAYGGRECGGPWPDDCGGTYSCPDCMPPAACVDGLCESPDAGPVDSGEDAGFDAGPDGGTDGGSDAGSADAGTVPDTGTDSGEEPANVVLPVLTASAAIRLDADKGNEPSLFFEAGKLFAFFNDTKADEPAKTMLYQRRSDSGGAAFDAPRQVSEGSFGADMIQTAGEFVVAAATGPVTLFFGSTDGGDSWHFHQSIWATNGACETRSPSRFVRPVPADPAFAQYYLYRGLFGCQDETHYVGSSGGVWGAGLEIASGAPSGAFQTGGRITVGTAWGAVYSDDGGAGWTAWPQGGTTKDQIRGTGMGMDDQGRLCLSNQYNYANEYALVLIISDPGAGGWSRRIRLRTSAHIIADSRVAVNGSGIVVAWIENKDGVLIGSYYRLSAFAMFSPDRGESWTAPVQIDAAPADRNIGGLAVAVDGTGAGAAWGETGEGVSWDFKGVNFSRLTW